MSMLPHRWITYIKTKSNPAGNYAEDHRRHERPSHLTRISRGLSPNRVAEANPGRPTCRTPSQCDQQHRKDRRLRPAPQRSANADSQGWACRLSVAKRRWCTGWSVRTPRPRPTRAVAHRASDFYWVFLTVLIVSCAASSLSGCDGDSSRRSKISQREPALQRDSLNSVSTTGADSLGKAAAPE